MIASQAVISGAFSLTRAAIQMGYCPRLKILHTSERADRPDLRAVHQLDAAGRGDAARASASGSSDNLGGAYGIAVTLAMLIDSVLIFVVMRRIWGWTPPVAGIAIAVPLARDRPRVPRVELAQDPRRRLVPAR